MEHCPGLAELEAVVLDGSSHRDVREHLISCSRCQKLSRIISQNILVFDHLRQVGRRRVFGAAGPDPLLALELARHNSLPGYELDLSRAPRCGSQGAVFLALDLETQRDVAIKMIIGDGSAPATGGGGLDCETHCAQVLDHPNIVRIHASGFTRDGFRYYVMDAIDGQPLDRALQDFTPKLHLRIELFQVICSAVGHAHHKRFVHLDLKPANILVDDSNMPYILDFGVATFLGDPLRWSRSRRGLSEQTGGTLRFAAPEQITDTGEPISRATDVYALGLILYEMLTARSPYPQVASPRGLVDHILHTTPPAPSSLRPGLHPRLDEIAMRALAKDPDDRYQSADELGCAVAEYVAHPNKRPASSRRDTRRGRPPASTGD